MNIQEIKNELFPFRDYADGERLFEGMNAADLADFLLCLNEAIDGTIHRLEVVLDRQGEHTTPVYVTPGVTVKEVGLGLSLAESTPSFAEYPREIVCESCDQLVAFARARVKAEDTMRAVDLVKPDGADYNQFDFVCDNCHAAGPFTVRDRPRTCLNCNGSGRIGGVLEEDGEQRGVPCPCCNGTGTISN